MQTNSGKQPDDYFKNLIDKHLKEIELIKQSLFGDDGVEDHPGIANVESSDWEWYADAYKKAADILLWGVQERRGYIDQLVYPIAALYRQSIELGLKRLHLLVFQAPKPPMTHDISKLWEGVKEQWVRYPKPRYYSERLNHLEKRLREFNQLDCTSQSFRYPTTTDGKPSFDCLTVNLRNMKDVANAIYMFIDQVATDIEERHIGP